jgi:transcriptional regulator with XRE-family HTH domain
MDDWTQLKTFAGRLRWARKRKGWSQAELGKKIGVSRNRIVQLEGGAPEGKPAPLPRPQKWHRLAHLLSVNRDWLIHGQGEPLGVGMTEEDAQAIATYHMLPPGERRVVSSLIEALANKSTPPEGAESHPTGRART